MIDGCRVRGISHLVKGRDTKSSIHILGRLSISRQIKELGSLLTRRHWQ
jgi:hypothetical protein